MEPIDKKLQAAIAKVGIFEVPTEGTLTIDNTVFGMKESLTKGEFDSVIEKIKGITTILDKNTKTTVIELIPHFENRSEFAHKFMFLCGQLKNKFKTPIFSLTPFGNFTLLHCQGNIDFAVSPEKSEKPEKVVTNKSEKVVKETKTTTKAKDKPETKKSGKRSTRKRK